MNKIIKNQNLLEVNTILTHLNSSEPKFKEKVISNKEGNTTYIDLKNEYKDWDEAIVNIIKRLNYELPIVCYRQLQMVKKEMNIIIPNCFKLGFKVDEITKGNIVMPFKILNTDKLILSPIFCDFQTYLSIANYSESTYQDERDIDVDEYYVILLLWKLREILHQKYQNQVQFELQLFPQIHSFQICKIEKNKEQLLYASLSKIQKKSNKIIEALNAKTLQELEINPFEIYQSDITIKNGQLINKRLRQNQNMRQKMDQNLIDRIERKHGIQNNNWFQIRYRNPIDIQSTLCLTGDYQQDLQHKILMKSGSNPKCTCGREIDPLSWDTVKIEYRLKEALDQIITLLQMDTDLDYTVFLLPLFLETEKDKYENEWIKVYFKDKNNDKVQLRELMFTVRMYNTSIDQITDSEGDQEQLFGGIDVNDFQDCEINNDENAFPKNSIEQYTQQDKVYFK